MTLATSRPISDKSPPFRTHFPERKTVFALDFESTVVFDKKKYIFQAQKSLSKSILGPRPQPVYNQLKVVESGSGTQHRLFLSIILKPNKEGKLAFWQKS